MNTSNPLAHRLFRSTFSPVMGPIMVAVLATVWCASPALMAHGDGHDHHHHDLPEPLEAGEDPRDAPENLGLDQDEIDAEFSVELEPLIVAYLAVVEGLAADDAEAAASGLKALHDDLAEIGKHRLEGGAHVAWMRQYDDLHAIVHAMESPPELAKMRSHLQALTLIIERIYVNFGADKLPAVNRAFCPMVEGGPVINDTPIGTWLQKEETIANPYHGATMLRCGEVYGQLGEEKAAAED